MIRKIDALIAEHVMGLETFKNPNGLFYFTGGESTPMGDPHLTVPHYSTDISAAWEVVEKADLFNVYDGLRYWGNPLKWQFYDHYDEFEVIVKADAAPMAICLAALKAKGIPLDGIAEGE